MLGTKLGQLGLLWLLSHISKSGVAPGASSAPTGPTGNPSTPRPSNLYPYASALPLPPSTPFSDDELLNEPTSPTEADRLWARFVVDPNRPGPRAKADDAPIARALSDFEHWALAPYFIRQDLDNVTLYNGAVPSIVPKEVVAQVPASMIAMTFGAAGKPSIIWVPRFHALMHERWWLGILAHELTHAAQRRMGGITPAESLALFKKYGYNDMPTEVQARWMQGQVLSHLDARAAAFYPPAK
jgi:hypothetical protein